MLKMSGPVSPHLHVSL